MTQKGTVLQYFFSLSPDTNVSDAILLHTTRFQRTSVINSIKLDMWIQWNSSIWFTNATWLHSVYLCSRRLQQNRVRNDLFDPKKHISYPVRACNSTNFCLEILQTSSSCSTCWCSCSPVTLLLLVSVHPVSCYSSQLRMYVYQN